MKNIYIIITTILIAIVLSFCDVSDGPGGLPGGGSDSDKKISIIFILDSSGSIIGDKKGDMISYHYDTHLKAIADVLGEPGVLPRSNSIEFEIIPFATNVNHVQCNIPLSWHIVNDDIFSMISLINDNMGGGWDCDRYLAYRGGHTDLLAAIDTAVELLDTDSVVNTDHRYLIIIDDGLPPRTRRDDQDVCEKANDLLSRNIKTIHFVNGNIQEELNYTDEASYQGNINGYNMDCLMDGENTLFLVPNGGDVSQGLADLLKSIIKE